MSDIDMATLWCLAANRSVARPGDREILADALEDLGREDMAAAIRAGRPWRTFLRGTAIAVCSQEVRRGPCLGTWIDGTPCQWRGGRWPGVEIRTVGEGRDERPDELTWLATDQGEILAHSQRLWEAIQ